MLGDDELKKDELEFLDKKELVRRFLILQRVRKHWRILAIQAAIGQATMPGLLNVCMKELMGIVPDDEYMDAKLQELVEYLEEKENDVEEFGELRSIIID